MFNPGDSIIFNWQNTVDAQAASALTASGRVSTITQVLTESGQLLVRLDEERVIVMRPVDILRLEDAKRMPGLAFLRAIPSELGETGFAVGMVVQAHVHDGRCLVQTLDSNIDGRTLKTLALPLDAIEYLDPDAACRHTLLAFARIAQLGKVELHASATHALRNPYDANNGNIDLIAAQAEFYGTQYQTTLILKAAERVAADDGLQDDYRAKIGEFARRLRLTLAAIDFAFDAVRGELAEQDADLRHSEKYLT